MIDDTLPVGLLEGRDLGTAAAPETAADGSSDFFFEPRGSQGGEEKR